MKTIIKSMNMMLVLALALTIIGCKHKKNDEPEVKHHDAPNWTVGAPKPLLGDARWTLAESDIDLSSHMYLTVALEQNVQEGDRLVALYDDLCVGIAEATETDYGWRFYMVISHKNVDFQNFNVTLGYYSSKSNQVVYWPDEINYEHNGIQGTTDAPYTLDWSKHSLYPYRMRVLFNLSNRIEPKEGDEMGIFVGDECRATINPTMLQTGEYAYQAVCAMNHSQETAQLWYFCVATGQIHKSQEFPLSRYNLIEIPDFSSFVW